MHDTHERVLDAYLSEVSVLREKIKSASGKDLVTLLKMLCDVNTRIVNEVHKFYEVPEKELSTMLLIELLKQADHLPDDAQQKIITAIDVFVKQTHSSIEKEKILRGGIVAGATAGGALVGVSGRNVQL
jgi:hypothetical protein